MYYELGYDREFYATAELAQCELRRRAASAVEKGQIDFVAYANRSLWLEVKTGRIGDKFANVLEARDFPIVSGAVRQPGPSLLSGEWSVMLNYRSPNKSNTGHAGYGVSPVDVEKDFLFEVRSGTINIRQGAGKNLLWMDFRREVPPRDFRSIVKAHGECVVSDAQPKNFDLTRAKVPLRPESFDAV